MKPTEKELEKMSKKASKEKADQIKKAKSEIVDTWHEKVELKLKSLTLEIEEIKAALKKVNSRMGL